MTENDKRPAPLQPDAAHKLLDLLATDDEFRDLFKNDPKAALIQVGHPAEEAELLAAQLKVETLADKAAIAQARDDIHANLTSSVSMQPIRLNVPSGSSPQLKK
ncbi:NHLP-related RiPP peptide [Xanthomonas campestris pv. raphani]|uniref:NHLP-related RiPP peptide n=1 Tax=Xanthomonas TaxID=338 RepID=UPI000E32C7A2|nr:MULTISPECIES: NHLP-related RiPP peptide [Xanthomonas]MEB1550823.1 NHLP-related RiPP peptide [Xanthomonas campestris pv. campestris]MCC5069844.1 NHLP-related RiPP peptide [Xanthomonas campestris]MCC5086307.1 NHLP-related RiPP peptide [Xanthomonas campestris]MCC8485739.1 NHLP-related RiPP peptide [Xanthomonas campestris]MEA9651814.1 NHLP-related RiPP peptide [Xanthomonas campestris pv. raphani]